MLIALNSLVGCRSKPAPRRREGAITTYHIASRVRIRDRDQETPLGMWGKSGLVVGIDALARSGGNFNHRPLQAYAVIFDGDSAPMDIYERWLVSA